MMAEKDELMEILLSNLKEAQIEIDQGQTPTRNLEEVRQAIMTIAKENHLNLALVEEVFREFENWRSEPLRRWRVVVKDIGHTEVGVVKARSKDEVLAAVQCIGMPCAPVENVEVVEVEAAERGNESLGGPTTSQADPINRS